MKLYREILHLINVLRFVFHSFIVLLRLEMGRWYVMRDRPLWFLVECVNLAKGQPEPKTEVIQEVGRLAEDELNLRLRKTKNLLDEYQEPMK